MLCLTTIPHYFPKSHEVLEGRSSSNRGGLVIATTLLEAATLWSRLIFIKCSLYASNYAQNFTCSLAQGAMPCRTSKIQACGNGSGLAFLLEDYKTVSVCLGPWGGSSDSRLGQGYLRQYQAVREHGQHTMLTPWSLSPPSIHPQCHPSGSYCFPPQFQGLWSSAMLSTQFHLGKTQAN